MLDGGAHPVQQRGEQVLGSEQMESLVLLVVLPGADGLGAGGAGGPQPVHVAVFLFLRLAAAHQAAGGESYVRIHWQPCVHVVLVG